MALRPVSDLKLHGGDPVLDFANSLDDRGTPIEQDFIAGYDAFILWCGHAGLLQPPEISRLRRWAREHRGQADAIARQAIGLREALRALLDALKLKRAPDADQLDIVNDLLPSRSELAFADGRFHLRQQESEGAAPLHMLAVRAVQLLTSDLQHRIHLCEGDRCDWYFLDRSRSRPRRWCSMKGCGNRAKGQRHASRKKIERKQEGTA